ncbi:MAG: hypothetical protein ACP6IY_20910 [Promethearchaeia archaeon]
MSNQREEVYLLKNGILFLLELPYEPIGKEYGIMKLYSLMPKHSGNAVNIYDLFITPDQNILKELRQEYIKEISESNISSKKRLFISISRKLYREFYAGTEETTIILWFKNGTRLLFKLNEDFYRKFLRDYIGLSEKDIENFKKIAVSGRDRYFWYIKDFLQYVKNIKVSGIKKFKKYFRYINYLKKITEDVDLSRDFSSLYKRTNSIVNVKIKFLDNGELIISRDTKLKIPNDFNFINAEIREQYEKGRELYLNYYRTKGLKILNTKELERFYDLLYKVRLRSQENINPEIIKEMLYYCSIIKTNYNLLKRKFNFVDNKIYPIITINLGIYTCFSRNFPKNSLTLAERDVFISDFLKNTAMTKSNLDDLIKYIRDIIFLFECAADLKYLLSAFKQKFEDDREIELIKNLSYRLIRDIFTRFIVSHDIFSSSVFIMFILATNKNAVISVRQIYTLEGLEVSHYSIPLHIGAIVSRMEKAKREGRPLLNITDETFKNKIRKTLIKLILERSIKEFSDINVQDKKIAKKSNRISEFLDEIEFFYRYSEFNEFLKPLNQKILSLINKFESISNIFSPKIRERFNELKKMVKNKIKEISESISMEKQTVDINLLKKYFQLNKEGLMVNPKTRNFINFKDTFIEWLNTGNLPDCKDDMEKLLIKTIFNNIKIILEKDKSR